MRRPAGRVLRGPVGPSETSAATPPQDILELAAATGSINGGPAPSISASSDSAPHSYQSRGGAMSEAAHAAATSGGAAPTISANTHSGIHKGE